MMSDTHAVVCDTAPGYEGYPRFNFEVTVDQARSILRLCLYGGGRVDLNGLAEWVELRDDGHVGYVNERRAGADRGSILERQSVIEAMREVLAPQT